jgi:hypothetical protein
MNERPVVMREDRRPWGEAEAKRIPETAGLIGQFLLENQALTKPVCHRAATESKSKNSRFKIVNYRYDTVH